MNSILQLIYDNYKKQLNNVAIVDENGSFTWKELFDYAYCVANKLLQCGIKKQDCVSIELSNCKEFIAGVIACQIIGAVYVPVGNAYPEERVKFIRKDCDVKVVIDNKFLDNLDLKNNKEVKPVDKKDEDIEMIIYTSGSTGRPKGVVHTLKSFYSAIRRVEESCNNITKNEKYAILTPFSFILGISEFLTTLIVDKPGLTLFIIPDECKKNPKMLIQFLINNSITKCTMSPKLAPFLPVQMIPTLNEIYLGSERVSNVYFENVTSIVGYGSTELGGTTLCYTIDKSYENSPIGKPLGNCQAYLFDENGKLNCEKGELCIAADLPLGYKNMPEETSKVFVDNPFYVKDGHKKMLKTGDIAYKNKNGDFVILGRNDFMVNIDGHRVELEEIEYRINQIEGIKLSTVICSKKNDQSYLVAYYLSEKKLSDDFIKKELFKNLANYMIPTFYIKLDKIPMLPNGKINRQALPKFDISSSQKKYVAPSNNIEKYICNVFAKVFNLEQVGTTDDFIALGGNSLTAMKLQADIQKKYNVAISSSEILALATPKHISGNIKYCLTSSDNLQINNLNKYSFNDTVPLSESQLNVYLDEISHKKNTAYNNPLKLSFTGFSKKKILDAVKQLLKQHPILKARIDNSQGNPCLKFDAQVEFNEIIKPKDFVRSFVMDKCLSRFSIMENHRSIDLYMDIHHIIADGESIHILGAHLMHGLQKPNKNISTDTGILHNIEYEQIVKKSNKYKEAKLFFDKMLCDSDEVDDLIESVNNDNAGTIEETLSVDFNVLNNFLKDKKITLNQYLTSAFAYTLSRFTGSDKALFCMIEDGRGNLNLDNCAGMFVKTLPLLIDCKDTSISKYLLNLKDLLTNTMKYDFYPFRLLTKNYKVTSDITFQYSHDIRNMTYEGVDFEEIEHDLVSELSVNVFNDKDNFLCIKVEHSKKYSDKLCKALISVYKKVIVQFISCKKLSDINYTSEKDLSYLNKLNATEKELKYKDILEAFKESIEKYPNNKLVTYEVISYTYSEGAKVISAIADKLREKDVQARSNVAILVQRSHWYELCALGVLTNGCAYVPIDDTYPDERIAFMLKDTSADAVIVANKTLKRAKQIVKENTINTKLINVDEIDYSKDSDNYTYTQVEENDTACILYTSGTTGKPKGSLITRKALINVIQWYINLVGFTCNDKFCMYCSFGFDGNILALFCGIYNGGCVDILPELDKLDVNKISLHFNKHKITHSKIPAAVIKVINKNKIKFKYLKSMLAGGEKLSYVDKTDYNLFDCYGPTECLVDITAIDCNDKLDVSSVGHILSNNKVYILDNNLSRVPCGAIGELYISGYQLAKGYLNREKETKQAFIHNPFDGKIQGYEKMYKTGDMVRILPDGTLGFIGRKDSQVKIRGNRVELGEVETCIRQLDFVKDCTVVAISNDNVKELVSYVVLNKDNVDKNIEDITEEIIKYISDNKPAYMVPAFMEIIDKIPLNVNGKVDKRALPKVNLNKLKSKYVAPANETEMIIVEAFKKVLNQDNIGTQDDFIRLGGDSLSAIRVVASLSDNNIDVDAKTILNKRTPILIAKEITVNTNTQIYEHVEGEVGLLPIQSYFFEQTNRNDFVQTFALKSKAVLNKEILQKSLDILIDHHDMLRASYKKDGNKVVQTILPQGSIAIYLDCIESTEENIRHDIESKMYEGINSLDMYSGKLIYILFTDTGTANYLTIAIHHLIIDGISWNILINDLTKIYKSLIDHTDIQLIVPYPYKKWVDAIYKYSETVSETTIEKYKSITDKINDEDIKGKAIGYSISINRSLSADNVYGFTEEEILLTALARAYKKTYDNDIVLNMENHGREDSIAKAYLTIGWFTSQYPLELKVSKDNDELSIIADILSVQDQKTSIRNLGLDYGAIVYIKNKLKYKHIPVTFNYLSEEFVFENKLFDTFYIEKDTDIESKVSESENICYGISLNISKVEEKYIISGQYASENYLSDKFSDLIDNFKTEINCIDKTITTKTQGVVCLLTESQMGVYLDEKTHKKETAYSCFGYYECKVGTDKDNAINAVQTLIKYHPILKARVTEHNKQSILVCDAEPNIEYLRTEDKKINESFEELIRPFDLEKELSRFWVVETESQLAILYDMHHMISDATSRVLINKELDEILNEKAKEKTDLGFLQASLYERKQKAASHYDKSKEFYEGLLCDIDEIGVLVDDVDGSLGSVSMPIRDIKEHLTEFSNKYNTSPGTVLNIVFGYTLSRFTGSDKALYNFTSNGRYLTETQEALGMYVKTIPNVLDCSDKNISEFIKKSSETILHSMDASIYPYRLLAKEYGLTNSITFEYNNTLNDVSNITSDNIIESDNADSVSDFLCVANDLDDGYLISISHSNRYSQIMAKRFIKCYKNVLLGLLTCEKLSDINFTSKQDLSYLNKLNTTEKELKYKDILQAFKESIEKYPDNRLVTYEDISYTYKEGVKVVSAIADKLRENDVQARSNVAILVQRSHWYELCALGVLTCGCTYVPIDDTYPDERIAFMLKDTSVSAVLATNVTINRASKIAKENSIQTNFINVDEIDYSGYVNSYSYIQVNEYDNACILYTSGTTGIPKGSLITRKAVINLSQEYVSFSKISKNDTYGLYSSFGFDVTLEGMYSILLVGASLNIVNANIRLDMYKLNQHFFKYNVTHTFMTTQVAKAFLNSISNSSLNCLVIAGEALGVLNDVKLNKVFDAYGPCECLSYVTHISVSQRINSTSVGSLNANTKCYVLDSSLRQVPVGAVGELYLSGYQLANGYLNREKETKDAFLVNPFDWDKPGYEKMYKTGDMVRILPDGTLGFVGRKDSQVKIRGNRVELGEVESCIRQLDFIEDCTVVTISNNNAKELVAYVAINKEIVSKNEEDTAEEITKHVSENKPSYMVPAFVEIIDKIPLNVNGKVDKRALPKVNLNKLKSTYVAPANETERIIVEAFEKVLGQENIGTEDDFIRLGGDSLSAIRVVASLSDNNIDVDAKTILNKRTPILIAKEITVNTNTQIYEHVEDEVGLLPIQSYFFEQTNRNDFVQTFALKSKTVLNKEILQKSLDVLINHHDMLRASYKIDGNKVVQTIRPQGSSTVSLDCIESSEENVRYDIMSKMSAGINSLDIYNGKLIYVLLTDTGTANYLTIAIHHLIIDGISWNILINDLTKIYKSLISHTDIQLVVPYPYKKWVDEIYKYSETVSETTIEKYKSITDKINDEEIKGKAIGYSISINRSLSADNAYGFTEEEILLTALARAYKKTYDEDIALNMENHGREDSIAKAYSTIGWFTSQYPLELKVSKDNDELSVITDILSVQEQKTCTRNLGIDYGTIVYIKNKLKYKHIPVTFNYLSEEFVFENELFGTFNIENDTDIESKVSESENICYGISLNISKVEEKYIISGQYASENYLSDKFSDLIDNFKTEIGCIDKTIKTKTQGVVCLLTESQMGVYLDEKTHKKDTAYSCFGYYRCKVGTDKDNAINAVQTLIKYHPILKARVTEHNKQSILVCDAEPNIEYLRTEDEKINESFEELIKPFDLEKELSRFWVVETETQLVISYDMHHMISDATSRVLINKELDEILNGKATEKTDLGFLQASLYERKQKATSHYDKSKEFYEGLLCSTDEIGVLFDDADGSLGSVSMPIRDIKERLTEISNKYNTSPGTVLNIAFGYTLSRFTGSDKALYNFTSNGRYLTETQEALGMYVKTIPNVLDCSDKNISEFIKKSSETILHSMDASIYPYRLLAKEYGLTNSITFEYNNTLNDVSNITSDNIIESDNADSVSDFLCVANDLDDGYLISVSHSNKYSQNTVKRFVKCYKEILVGLLTCEKLSDINYTSEEEISYLNKLNATEKELKYRDILEAFKESIEKYPNNKLVTYEDISYTYSEGAKVISAIADKLREKDVQARSNAAILVQRSHWYELCALGVLTNGCAYVPIDDSYPNERIAFMLKDTSADAVLVTNETVERAKEILKENSIQTKLINADEIDYSKDRDNYTYTQADESDTACILYTSGTTGKPKGSLITRRAVINLSQEYVLASKLSQKDVYGMFVSYVFDMHTLGLYAPLMVGASLNVVPEKYRLNLKQLNEYFVSHKCTHTYITSQVGKLFAQSGFDTTIKLLCFGGMKLGHLEAPDSIGAFESYGPTENLAISTYIYANERNTDDSIGSFLHNTKGYILDSTHRRVPVGAVGELYLSGYQLANGYLNREKEAKEAFLYNPFDADKLGYEKMYKTGDMVRILPDGTLGFIGRKDSQVKIRGNRVELGEVETCIRQLDFVKDCTVVAISNNNAKELVSYVVLNKEVTNKNEEDTAEEITKHISENKPSYMVPAFVEIIDKIPLNVNGKVDKRALPKVNLNKLKSTYVAPANETEKIIVEAFEKVLGQENIGTEDDFIRLGGDSLSAIRAVSIIDNVNIGATEILSLKTAKQIAKRMDNTDLDLSDLDIVKIKDKCPLNEPQLNVYLDIKRNEKVDSYIIPSIIKIDDKYTEEDIKEALTNVLKAHNILSSCISEDENGIYLIQAKMPNIEYTDSITDEKLSKYLVTPFSIEKSLSKYLIFKRESNLYLASVFHHLVFDGLSNFAFESELRKALNKEKLNIDNTYLYSSAFTSKVKDKSIYKDAEDFFESQLCDIDDIPTFIEDTDGASGQYSQKLDADKETVVKYLKENSISASAFMSCAFAYTVSRFTGSDKAIINIIENGRDRYKNSQSAIGMFVNTLPIAFDCKNKQISGFIKRESEKIYKTTSYNFYGFRLLAKKYNIDSSVMFQFDPEMMQNTSKPDKDIKVTQFEQRDTISDLSVNVIETKDTYKISITHSKKYSHKTAKAIVNTFNKVVNGILTCEKLSDINYTSEEEISYLNKLNATEKELKYRDILEAFKESIEKYPNNKLVTYEDISYTYSEGAKVISAIADKLREKDVQARLNVAILVQRSHWYELCALGVLTNGCAYVPIDDSYPNERIAFMLKDTSADAVLVTNETVERAKEILKENSIQTKLINVDEIDYSKDRDNYTYTHVDESDIACILYTSGTTGKPKGSLITRKAVLNLSYEYVSSSKLSQKDVYGLYSSFGFDAPLVGMYPILLMGASINIVNNNIRLDMLKLNQHFIKHNVTHTFMTTQVAKAFLKSVSDTSITCLVIGGEASGDINHKNLCKVYDGYGPCECLCYVTHTDVEQKINNISVGKLNINTKCYILDSSRKRVPVGAVGELYLSGYQLASGYLNREKETEETFLDNPFDGDKSGYEKMYKTGDMVRILPDGTLGFIGRKDSQVKIRGNRVELGEVETCIRQLDLVTDCTVVTISNNNTKEVVAYVVLNKEISDINIEDITEKIRKYISTNKPSYMVPSFVEIIDDIPLNVNGKVDKRALPKPNVNLKDGIVKKPNTNLERILHDEVCSVLGLDKDCIGVNTQLKNCGIDSLSAIIISSILSKKYEINLSAVDLLQVATIEDAVKKITYFDKNFYNIFSNNDDNKKLVFVHPGIAGSVSYFEFSKLISDKISFSCIEDYNVKNINNRITGHKNIAKLYVDILKGYQPNGPYFLGGWSYGGNIAYEMGCILKSYGDEVKKIYMLDSVYSKIALNDDEKLNYIKSNVNAAFSNNKILSIINVFSDDLIDLYKQAYFYKIEDSLSYVPSYFDGDVFMFKAIGKQKNQDNLNLKRDLDNGYGKFAKHMYIKELPFTHTELMDEKPAKIIADEILKDMLLE